jgi:hypothetical protein
LGVLTPIIRSSTTAVATSVFVLEDDVRHALNIQIADRNTRLVRQIFLISLHAKTASCLYTMADGDQQMDKGRKKSGKKVIKRRTAHIKTETKK